MNMKASVLLLLGVLLLQNFPIPSASKHLRSNAVSCDRVALSCGCDHVRSTCEHLGAVATTSEYLATGNEH